MSPGSFDGRGKGGAGGHRSQAQLTRWGGARHRRRRRRQTLRQLHAENLPGARAGHHARCHPIPRQRSLQETYLRPGPTGGGAPWSAPWLADRADPLQTVAMEGWEDEQRGKLRLLGAPGSCTSFLLVNARVCRTVEAPKRSMKHGMVVQADVTPILLEQVVLGLCSSTLHTCRTRGVTRSWELNIENTSRTEGGVE